YDNERCYQIGDPPANILQDLGDIRFWKFQFRTSDEAADRKPSAGPGQVCELRHGQRRCYLETFYQQRIDPDQKARTLKLTKRSFRTGFELLGHRRDLSVRLISRNL